MLHHLELAVLSARRREKKIRQRGRGRSDKTAYWARVNEARAVREYAEARRERQVAGAFELWHRSEVGSATSEQFMDRGTEDWCRREARRELQEPPQSGLVVLYLVSVLADGEDWEELGRVSAN